MLFRSATTTTTAASVVAAEQIHRGHGGIGLSACATAGFVTKGVDSALRAQMRIGTGLEIVLEMRRWLTVKVVFLRFGSCGTMVSVATIASITAMRGATIALGRGRFRGGCGTHGFVRASLMAR